MSANINNIKLFSNDLRRIRQYSCCYKYLTYDTGLKMIANTNLQFTRADKLNDEADCHISMIDFDFAVETAKSIGIDSDKLLGQLKEKFNPFINGIGICSLGTTYDNAILWKRYTGNDGICIGLNHKKIINYLIERNLQVISFEVDYVNSTKKIIPYVHYLDGEKDNYFKFFRLLFGTKNAEEWSEEKEVRIILPKQLDDNFFRVKLKKNFFEAIYLSKNTTSQQYEEITNLVRQRRLNVKIAKITE